VRPIPRLSVLLPVHNGYPYLPAAVESILAQSFRDFEFLVIDDGSTDETSKFLSALSDCRVHYNRLEKVGLPAALNYGLNKARTSLIARMDADDVCESERLQHQVGFLDRHQESVIVGCQSTVIDPNDDVNGERHFPVEDMAIRWQMAFGCPFQHPGVMYRREAVLAAGAYRKEEYPADDYGLWTRLAKLGQMANLDRKLLKYRVHPKSISLSLTADQTEHCSRIAADYACAISPIDHSAFRDLYHFLASGSCPPGRGAQLEVAFTTWRKLFVATNADSGLGYWMSHVQRRLRWHCLERAKRGIMRPADFVHWLRMASRFDPENGTLRSIAWRALRKISGSAGFQRNSTTPSRTVENVLGVGRAGGEQTCPHG
jgi:glycosyltransferase involved in cell wall biosynthesis